MKQKQYRMIAYVAFALLLFAQAFGIVGCGTKSATPAPTDNRITGQSVGTKANKAIGNPKQVAAHLETLAKGIKGVKGANCVVFGKYAIVGIDVDEKMERSRVGTIKYSVAEAFRKDPYGINAIVTADMDLSQRVREIRADVKSGHPITGFTDELSDIVGRLIPQIPRNIVPHRTPEDTGTKALNKLKK